MDLSGVFDTMLEYLLLDGSKFVDGTYTYSSATGYPVITNSGGDLGGVVRKSYRYSYSNNLTVSTTSDGHKILTPPDGSTQNQDGCWCYYSMYQRDMTTSIFYRVAFDLRLVNLAGVTLSNVSRAVLGNSNLASPLNIIVNTATGATLGGVALPERIMTGDWVHVDLYIWDDGSTHSTLVIDGDLTHATDVSFTLPSYPPNFAFAANALNSSDWPECPHVELGNPSIYLLQKAAGTPFVSDTALSVTQSGTESATLTASVSYGDDPAAERYVDSAGWIKCTSAGAVDSVPDVPTYTADEECDLLYTGTTTCKVIRSGGTVVSTTVPFCGIHRVQPLEDFMQTAWSTGDSSRTITVTESGTYTVTVTNPGGSVTASVTVAVPTTETDYDRIFRGDPVPEGAWLFGQSNAYRTGIATVQSQYSASPRILALAGMYWDMLNPGSEIQTMLDDMLNPSTARGYGLDVWGRIVGIKRAMVPVSGEYLAFDPDPMSNPDGDSWNNAPFNPLTAQGLATDAVFRVYVMVKAMMNIGNGSLADINKYFSLMFPGSGIQVIHAGTMIIRVLDYDAVLTDAAIMALRSIDWVPAGVGWQVWHGEPDCFGFLGSELQPFDQAPFISDSALIFE